MPYLRDRTLKIHEFLSRLEDAMLQEYAALHPGKNPVATGQWRTDHLAYLITQYSFLSKNSVAYLTESNRILIANGWDALAAEIAQNIQDESGNDCLGEAHYEIFSRGARQELDLDLAAASPKPATAAFLDAWLNIPAAGSPESVAGALFAFELSGVPEMTIAKALVERCALHRVGRPLDPNGTLAMFFDAHITAFEVQHAERIRETVGHYLRNHTDDHRFSAGFRALLRAMDTWWSGLGAEARSLPLPE